MRRALTRLLLFLIACRPMVILGQVIDNTPDPTRWLTYSQPYIKLPIVENGLYRMTSGELQQAGIPIDRINPMSIQLFHRGVEQAIYIEGETDGHIDTGDFLEFYGRRNDGVADSLLYRPYRAQPHSYYSLFSDTTAYFLTWRQDGKPGKRMVIYTDTLTPGLTPASFYWADELRLFTDNYPGWAAGLPSKIEYSHYESGEGYTGEVQQKDKPFTSTFSLANAVRTGPEPQIELLLVGRDYTNHRVDCLAGPGPARQRLLDSIRFSTYANARLQQPINWADVSPDSRLYVSTISRGEYTSVDMYSVSYIHLRYPRTFVSDGQPQQRFQLEANPVGRSLIAMANPADNTRFWDITDPASPIRIGISAGPDSVRLIVHDTDKPRLLLSASQPKTVSASRPVVFTNWTIRTPTYLIISHEDLMKPVSDPTTGYLTNAVRDYAAYRASAAGGGHDTLIVTMQQLIDQYNYGERSPLAIRQFVKQLLQQNQGRLQYMLLAGTARSTPGTRHEPNQALLDRVMTAGFPGSDMVLTSGLTAGRDDVPSVPTGRINASTPEEVINYLNKVKEYERQPTGAGWRKNLLHLSGGQSVGERDLFRRLVDSYRDQATAQSLGAGVSTFSKLTDTPVESLNLAEFVNAGIGLITFVGHSGIDVTDLDIGFCSNDGLGYRNKGVYPLLLINGCAISNFFFGKPTLATDWVLTPNRGAIGAMAHSHLGHPDVMHRYTTTFYSLLTDSTQLHQSIGRLQQETIRRILAQSTDGRDLANCQQMVLQGDPAIRLFPFSTPDYGVFSGGLTVQSANGQQLSAESDSVQIRAIVQNGGQYWHKPLPIRVRRWVNGRESGVVTITLPHSVAFVDTLTVTFPNERGAEGQNEFEVTINPADAPAVQAETNHSNNQARVELMIPGPKPVLIYPPPNGVVSTASIRLTAHFVSEVPRLIAIELDTTAAFNSTFRRVQRVSATNSISVPARLSDRPNVLYYWRVRLLDSTGTGLSTGWSTSSFLYSPDSLAAGLPEGQLQMDAPVATDIRQGDVISIRGRFTNLSPFPFSDSLVVQQTIYAAKFINPAVKTWLVKAPTGMDTIRIVTEIPTETLPGINRLVLTVNPKRQPEYSFLNNTLDLRLPVQPDQLGPVLEVAIDGARIADGDVVSARPVIDIFLTDENRSLLITDTTSLDMYLQRPGKNTPIDRLSWRGARIQPEPGNRVWVRYPFSTLPEGIHHLLVTARDVAGNQAVPYRVGFRVLHEPSLTNLIVYPNPFRVHTVFSIYLTGEQAPASLSVTLWNLTGQLVRQRSWSPRIGLNEWQWEGHDDQGNPLPAGVYLYKLVVRDEQNTDWPIASNLNQRLSGRIMLIR